MKAINTEIRNINPALLMKESAVACDMCKSPYSKHFVSYNEKHSCYNCFESQQKKSKNFMA